MDQPPPFPERKTSGLAITSLVLGILGFICCGLLSGIVAIITGHIAQSKIKRSQGLLTGEGLAIAGFVMGYASLFTTFILAALAAPAISGAIAKGQMIQKMNNARQVQLAMQSIALDGVTSKDKSLGCPADAGITTVTELKNLLVKNGGFSPEDVEKLHLDDFLIGNVSASDPPHTIFIRSKPENSDRGFIIIRRGGDGGTFKPNQQNLLGGDDPPRDPPYLKP